MERFKSHCIQSETFQNGLWGVNTYSKIRLQWDECPVWPRLGWKMWHLPNAGQNKMTQKTLSNWMITKYGWEWDICQMLFGMKMSPNTVENEQTTKYRWINLGNHQVWLKISLTKTSFGMSRLPNMVVENELITW